MFNHYTIHHASTGYYVEMRTNAAKVVLRFGGEQFSYEHVRRGETFWSEAYPSDITVVA